MLQQSTSTGRVGATAETMTTASATGKSSIDAVNTTATRNSTGRCECVPPVAKIPIVIIRRPPKTTGGNRLAGISDHGKSQHTNPATQASTVTTHSTG